MTGKSADEPSEMRAWLAAEYAETRHQQPLSSADNAGSSSAKPFLAVRANAQAWKREELFPPVPEGLPVSVANAAARRWLDLVGTEARAANQAFSRTAAAEASGRLRRRWAGGTGVAGAAAIRGAMLRDCVGVRNVTHEVLSTVLQQAVERYFQASKAAAARRRTAASGLSGVLEGL